jgi:SAM-dependent methyltransferase
MELPPFLYNALQRYVHTDYSPIAKFLLEAYAPVQGQPVLELGCGTGLLSEFFPPGTYTGVDTDAARVDVARKRYPHAAFLHRDATALPVDLIAGYPFIFCHAWIHHIPDDACMQIIERIADAAQEREIWMVIVEPLLPRLWTNPPGWLIAKLDRGRYVRTAEHMERLMGPYLQSATYSKPSWRWPIPGGAFHLRFSPVSAPAPVNAEKAPAPERLIKG